MCMWLQEYRGQQLKQLVHALCPAIYGHELVKAGVLLSLFGGVRKGSEDQASAPVRGDIHCLLVGDPGIGKSQLLKVLFVFSSRFFCSTRLTGHLSCAAGQGLHSLR